MKDEKDLEKSLTDEKIEEAITKSDAYDKEQLDEELEKLAEAFRTEMKKAKEQEENNTENEPEKIKVYDSLGEIPEEELCECCFERRKEENDTFCKDCRELMRRYPISIAGAIIAVAMVFVAVISLSGFITDFSGYNKAKAAKDFDKENKKSSAIASYDEAISFFLEKDVVPKKLLKDSAYDVFSTLPGGVASFYDVSQRIEDALTKTEAKLPIYSGYEDLRDQSLIIYETFNQFYAIINNTEYASFDGTDKALIEKIFNEIGSLSGKELTVKSLKTGETKTVVYDEAAIYFSQFMFAYSCSEYDLAYDCLKKLNEISPECIKMYAYELAIIETQYGNYDASNKLADDIVANNAEDVTAYVVYSYNNRMKGNIEKALKDVEKGLSIDSADPDLYRQKGILLALKGDFEKAIEAIEKGLETDQYGVMYLTEYAIALEAGDKEKAAEIKGIIENAGAELPDRLKKFADGKITFKELFTEGTGDVE